MALITFIAEIRTAANASCADKVSTMDKSVGISAVADASCMSGGPGCTPHGDQCRFCRESETSQALHLTLCSEVQVARSFGTESAGKTQSKNGSPSSDESVNIVATSMPTTLEESTITCLSLVSIGDKSAGISAVSGANPSCSANGLGCFQSGQCRFCQSRATAQSTPFIKCSDLGGPTIPASITPLSSNPSPRVTSAPTATSTSTTCSMVATKSELQGISFVVESRCNVASPTLIGCSAQTSCRLCRNNNNEGNQYLITCNKLADKGSSVSAEAGIAAEDFKIEALSSQGTDTAKLTPNNSIRMGALGRDTGNIAIATQSVGTSSASISSPIGAVAAVAALIVVAIMSVMYVKARRDSFISEPSTPDAFPDSDVLTPQGGHGYTPREGSMVLVKSQSSVAAL